MRVLVQGPEGGVHRRGAENAERAVVEVGGSKGDDEWRVTLLRRAGEWLERQEVKAARRDCQGRP